MKSEQTVMVDTLASRGMRISGGYFAFGLFIGVAIATGFYLNVSACEPEQSTLWFCGESPEIVLATLSFLNDLAKAVAWPFAAIAVVWLFSGELKGLLPRLTRVGPTGAEFEGKLQPEAFRPGEVAKLEDVDLTELHDPVAQRIEQETLDALRNYPDTDHLKILVRSLTEARMLRAFERLYSNIFGSQIEALQVLNARDVSHKEAVEMFERVKAERGILDGWNLDMYMAYLLNAEFVIVQGDTFKITETGRNFLRFIVDNHLSTEKLN
ncbi:hypothetical protein GCM10016455_03970 [Aliiroseovarius zhejiangensis]|uniref:Uncharacterized protein n=2 Tax=Aliiroseovarius zhejiangensis TaxID=1632025 RepID=A0ABQ3ILH9_9RHOB|nr:hypothetical protein GCM10016455_03970 [Aliiroseovarius zhejiangensis]